MRKFSRFFSSFLLLILLWLTIILLSSSQRSFCDRLRRQEIMDYFAYSCLFSKHFKKGIIMHLEIQLLFDFILSWYIYRQYLRQETTSTEIRLERVLCSRLHLFVIHKPEVTLELERVMHSLTVNSSLFHRDPSVWIFMKSWIMFHISFAFIVSTSSQAFVLR